MIPPLLRGPFDFAGLRWRFAHYSSTQIRRYQQRKLDLLLDRVLADSPFYRELYEGCDRHDFRTLPTIEKATMMAEFDRVNTVGVRLDDAMEFALEAERDRRYLGYYLGRYVVGLSTGTSGARGLYLTDRAISERLPFAFLARSGVPWRLLPFRIAFFLRVFSQGFADISSALVKLEYMPTTLSVDRAIERINELEANVLMGPPSMLRLLAARRSEIRAPIGTIVSYAEVLEVEERKLLSRSFGAPVVEIYQASEGLIACPCEAGRLHINEDLMYVELEDEECRPITEPGVPSCRMIVTNLYNEVQPLIRYELNDRVVLGDPCACGSRFRVIDHVIGRQDDVLYFEMDDGSMGHVFPDVVSRWIITATDRITEYRVEQTSLGRLVITVEPTAAEDAEGVSRAIEASVVRGLSDLGFRSAGMEFRFGPIERGDGKYKRFLRLYTPRDG